MLSHARNIRTGHRPGSSPATRVHCEDARNHPQGSLIVDWSRGWQFHEVRQEWRVPGRLCGTLWWAGRFSRRGSWSIEGKVAGKLNHGLVCEKPDALMRFRNQLYLTSNRPGLDCFDISLNWLHVISGNTITYRLRPVPDHTMIYIVNHTKTIKKLS
jgi:hypothetical protein